MIKHEHCISGNMNVKNGEDTQKKEYIKKKNKKLCGRKEREKRRRWKYERKKGRTVTTTIHL